MRWVFSAICVFVPLLTAGSLAARQASQKMTYETFCNLPDAQAKRAAFNAVTPDNRAELVKAQLERWREANKSRLSQAQLALLDQMHELVTPESYTAGPAQESARDKIRALEPKMAELFSMADRQAMQPNAPCLPKVK
jgi:hypothetical protein